MPLEAQITRSKIYEEKPYLFTVPLFTSQKAQEKLPDDATSAQQFWYRALRKLQLQYSEEAFACAERFGAQKKGYDAVACALTTLFINPDHEKARSFFGRSLYENHWRTQWEMRQIEKGLVDDPVFGWIPSDRVEKYREGKRFYKNQWITAEEEEKKIRSGDSGWRVETEHFSILSRVSLERGVEIGRFLESYYQCWSRLFYRFIANDKQWASRLYSSGELVTKRHKIILYRNRAEYTRELRKYDSNVALSVGGYFPSMRCIFVYEPEKGDDFELLPLLAHEATHQLFNECNIFNSTRGKVEHSNLARRANFWAVEGIAVYAETFKLDKSKSSASLGGYLDVFRVDCARESLDEGTCLPLETYAGFSMKEFQSQKDLSLLYTQAAGLTFFFMHYKDGAYRNAFVNYVFLIYMGKDSPDSLERLTGKTFEELDAEYKEFMTSL